jgi:hypothetical protein
MMMPKLISEPKQVVKRLIYSVSLAIASPNGDKALAGRC